MSSVDSLCQRVKLPSQIKGKSMVQTPGHHHCQAWKQKRGGKRKALVVLREEVTDSTSERAKRV